MKRASVRRTAICLATVCAAYWLYASFAVPALIPSVSLNQARNQTISRPPRAYPFERWFSESSWERKRRKVLAIGQGKLLFDDYTPSDDGLRLRLPKCTLIFYPEPSIPDADEKPLILRAPQGATLFFETPIDIARMQVGQMAGGVLTGHVTIDRPPSGPAADDALRIETSNVQIAERRIWTPESVQFSHGPNRGSGRHLLIELHPPQSTRQPGAEAARQPGAEAAQFGRLKSLELLHVTQLQLSLEDGLFSSQLPGAESSTTTSSAGANRFDIHCEGPLRVDFDQRVATLSDRVTVAERSAADGDELKCELLELHLEDRHAASNSETSSRSALQPKLLIAEGYPVQVQAPSRGVTARTQRLEYDLVQRRVHMSDRKLLRLRHTDCTINAPELTYQFMEGERLGSFWASGPGNLNGVFEGQAIAASWGHELRLEPTQPGKKVLFIRDARRVSLETLGDISADELHLYLSETDSPTSEETSPWRLDSLQAKGNVAVDSPRMSADLSVARIWFRTPQSGKDGAAATVAPNAPPSPSREPRSAPPTPHLQPDPRPDSPPEPVTSRHHLKATKLHALVALAETPVIEQLDVVGEVELRDVSAGGPRGIDIRGDRFELRGGGTSNPVGTLVGRPAQGVLREMGLVGNVIVVEQGANSVKIPGPGSMQIQPTSPQSQERLPPVTVHWTGDMVFDGVLAKFRENVVVSGSQITEEGDRSRFYATGPSLDVTLTRPVNLQQAESNPDVDIHELVFVGPVALKHELFDPRGVPKSVEQMNARDLRIHQVSGDVRAAGPGWLTRRGQATDLGIRRSQPSTTGLSFLRVDFVREMTGNLHSRDIRFHQDIRCLQGSITHWEEELRFTTREMLGEDDVLLTSDTLQVVQVPIANRTSVELHAEGNIQIFGRLFAGSGHRVSYARAKDQLILVGDGLNDARLAHQKTPHATPNEIYFRRAEFYPRAQQMKIDGVASGEVHLDQVDLRSRPAPRRRPPAPRRF